MTLLSTTAEWHATAVGALVGFLAGARDNWGPLTAAVSIATQRDPFTPGHRRDIQHESGYLAGAALVGYVVGRWVR